MFNVKKKHTLQTHTNNKTIKFSNKTSKVLLMKMILFLKEVKKKRLNIRKKNLKIFHQLTKRVFGMSL